MGSVPCQPEETVCIQGTVALQVGRETGSLGLDPGLDQRPQGGPNLGWEGALILGSGKGLILVSLSLRVGDDPAVTGPQEGPNPGGYWPQGDQSLSHWARGA